MAISKITSSGLAGDKYNVMTAGNNYYEPLASTLVTSTSSAITFSNIPQEYKHLQIRYFCKTTRVGGASGSGVIEFNGDTTAANYSTHVLYGAGASATAAGYANNNYSIWYYGDTTTFVAGVVDVLDYANTNKYKTIRNLTGYDQNGAGQIALVSMAWRSTAAVSSISLTPSGYSFNTNSRFSLYGLKG